ncbi:MAG: methyltransferase [Acidimicrobiales bacterium]|nr:methyltransferase [Acidimicrobiales bacterium]
MVGWTLAGYALFLSVVFGMRTILHFRHTGRTGWVPFVRGPDAVTNGVITLGLAGALVAPLLDLTDALSPLSGLNTRVGHLLGGLALVTGATMSAIAQTQMGGSWKAGTEPSVRNDLVTTGLFATVRNPFYLGMMLVVAGVALVVPNVVAVVSVAALVVGVVALVHLVEEPGLSAAHGEDYAAYARSVGRFVPGVGRHNGRGHVG